MRTTILYLFILFLYQVVSTQNVYGKQVSGLFVLAKEKDSYLTSVVSLEAGKEILNDQPAKHPVSDETISDQQISLEPTPSVQSENSSQIMTTEAFLLNAKLGYGRLPFIIDGSLFSLLLEFETVLSGKPVSDIDNSNKISWLIQLGGGYTFWKREEDLSVTNITDSNNKTLETDDVAKAKNSFNKSLYISALTGFKCNFWDFTGALTGGVIMSQIEGGPRPIASFSVGWNLTKKTHLELHSIMYYPFPILVLSVGFPLKIW